MTRREALSTAVKAGIGVAVAAVAAGAAYEAYTIYSTPKVSNLEWVIWPWGQEMVADTCTKFDAANPDINAKSTVGSGDYTQYVYTRFASGNPPDMYYTSPDMDHFMLQKGWSADVEDYESDITEYKSYLYPGLADFYINPATGKMWGLNYWAGAVGLAYNQRHLTAAGFSGPPKDYDELASQALAIKNAGITQYPFGINFAWGFGVCIYNIMNGYHDPTQTKAFLFDENLNPIFNQPNSPLFQALRWLLDRIWVDKTMSTGVIQYDEGSISTALGQGSVSYALAFPCNDIAAANAPKNPETGNVHFGLNPGSGYCNFQLGSYVTSANVWKKGSTTQDAIWRLLQVVGGKSTNYKPDFANGTFMQGAKILSEFGVTSGYKEVNESDTGRAALTALKVVPDEIYAQFAKLTPSMWRDPITPSWWSNWWMSTANTNPSNSDFASKFEKLMIGQSGHTDQDITNFLNDVANDWNNMKTQAGGQ